MPDSLIDQMLRDLRDRQRELRERDPLLQRGIERDWVCVLDPQMAYTLRSQALHEGMNSKTAWFFPGDPPRFLEQITGRETYVLNHAPAGLIEYMEKETMLASYAADFFRNTAQPPLDRSRRELVELELGYAVPDHIWETWEYQWRTFGSGNGRIMRD